MAARTPLPLVDTHFHVFGRGVAVPGARYVPGYDAPLHAWDAAARLSGVTHGVLVQPSFLGCDNGRLLRELRGQPDRLRGVVVVAPDQAGDLPALHAAGARGLRINLAGRPQALDPWVQATALWDAMLALGWHLELHTDRGALPAALDRLPRDLPLVVDHMGKPDSVSSWDPTVAALVRQSHRLHVKLSGAYRNPGLDAGALARLWRDEIGAGRLLWGSDWPCTNHEDQADHPRLFSWLAEWIGDAAAHRALAANPAALYWGG